MLIILVLGINAYGERRLCRIFIWDNAGPGGVFSDPDLSSVDVRPADAIFKSLNEINTYTIYSLYDSLEIVLGGELPLFPEDFDLIFVTLGWPGTDSRGISEYEDSILFDFLRYTRAADRTEAPCGLYIEGNNFGYEYGDTSSYHHTYSTLMWTVGGVLWEDEGFHFTNLIGLDNSVAEGMVFSYPGEPGYGPHTSCDIIGINDEAIPTADFAQYVFNAGITKDPARGMQRRGYAGGGAVILYAFVFGNLSDSMSTGSKANLMFSMVDFLLPPNVTLATSFSGLVMNVDSSYNIQYNAYDNCGIVLTIYEYSMGGSWIYIDGFTGWDSSFVWTIPATPSNNVMFRVSVWDSSQNWAADTSEHFRIDTTAVGIGESLIKPDKHINAFVYPNPFNARTSIFVEPETPGYAEIRILNVRGECLQVVCDQYLETGKHRIPWDSSLKDLPSGIYFANIRQNGHQQNMKMLLLR